jgi:hypothetical protein
MHSMYPQLISELTKFLCFSISLSVTLTLFLFYPTLSEHSKEFPFLEKYGLLSVKPRWDLKIKYS